MCGIGALFTAFCKSEANTKASIDNLPLDVESYVTKNENELKTVLENRGPNNTGTYTAQSVVFVSCVLHIQGDSMLFQPIVDSDGNVLLWNGEVFDGIDHPLGSSDTLVMSERLQNFTANSKDGIHQGIIESLSEIKGPYAFIFYHLLSETIYFGRDPIGRRSLLIQRDNDNKNLHCISSTSVNFSGFEDSPWEEVNIGGVYSIHRSGDLQTLQRFPWSQNQLRLHRLSHLDKPIHQPFEKYVDEFVHFLQRALYRRIVRLLDKNISTVSSSHECKIGVLFSGGIDSLLLAAMLHLAMLEYPLEPIELFNVAFQEIDNRSPDANTLAPDRLAAISGVLELQRLFPARTWRLVHIDVAATERAEYEPHIKNLIKPLDTHMDLNIGTAFWFAARGNGYLREYTPNEEASLFEATANNGSPLLRIGEEDALKSVGLTAEKLLFKEQCKLQKAELHQQQADLNNDETDEIAAGVKVSKAKKVLDHFPCRNEDCQRMLKIGCIHQSCKRCCDKLFQQQLLQSLGEIDKTQLGKLFSLHTNNCPVHKIKEKQLKKLQSKLPEDNKTTAEATEEEGNEKQEDMLDHSSTRADGSPPPSSSSSSPQIPYLSTCKAVLVGLGADEQLAGYGRHRTTFLQGGYEALCEEMNKDLSRLWQRNLGRDDRCIADHGREAWFPYLDEEFVEFIQSLPISIIADLNQPPGIGDKRILRCAARSLGLERNSQLVKRAIQFGTFAAKQTSVQYYGSRRKGKGESKI